MCRRDHPSSNRTTESNLKKEKKIAQVTCSDTLAPSYLDRSSLKSGSVAELAASNKHRKYKGLLEQNYLILPFAVETLGVWCSEAIGFIKKLGKMITQATGEKNSTLYLKQRISLAIQRNNAARVMDTFDVSENMKEIFYILKKIYYKIL